MTSSPGTAGSRSLSDEALLATYGEVCRSYHAIDEFRMKLLGLLPLASLIGVVLLDNDKVITNAVSPGTTQNELVRFAAVFAAALTFALFLYEVRGIRRSHNLVMEGKHLEALMGIDHG